LAVAVFYVRKQQRMLIERELRASFNAPCGDQ